MTGAAAVFLLITLDLNPHPTMRLISYLFMYDTTYLFMNHKMLKLIPFRTFANILKKEIYNRFLIFNINHLINILDYEGCPESFATWLISA